MTLTLYRLNFEDRGPVYTHIPDVPDYLKEGQMGYIQIGDDLIAAENDVTPRICTCPTVPGCLTALNIDTYFDSPCIINETLELYLYKTEVDIESVYFPTSVDVYDAWKTGEVWITKPTEFYKVDKVFIKRLEPEFYTGYTKYNFWYEDMGLNKPRKDIHNTDEVIEGYVRAFTFIGRDFSRVKKNMEELADKIKITEE